MDNTGYTPEEPIAAIATALAPSALGIIRVSGKNSIELLSKIFSRPKALVQAAGNTIVYGWIKDGDKKIDEVLVSVFRSPKSFTGEDMAEISCHGGVSVVTTIFNLILKNGFRKAERGEYTFRAYINGKADLTKAEAVREIIESRTDSSRSRAAGRLAGSLYEEINSIKKLIVDTLAAIEVEIEYPEDEETIADAFDREGIVQAIMRLKVLKDSWKSEKLFQDGARLVLCGKTNAGKSSLFNAMLKEDRAIVSDVEGTTRDWIESWVSIQGIPARLFDTAGLRQTDDIVEQSGVERTHDLSEDADLILYLADSTQTIKKEDLEFLTNIKVPVLFVWNKIDKLEGADVVSDVGAASDVGTANGAGPELDASLKSLVPTLKAELRLSAKKALGIEKLTSAIFDILTTGKDTTREQAGLGSERQKVAVEQALECVEHALVAADDNYTLDAVVQDLEDSLDFLGEITGEVTPEDVLGSIFSNFCVGK
ncbi:tRNA uridine-5-carboxymethylaminomethyl(34) synthesis GTPase MnmE [Treponema sp.]|uniref:tRNA uridine-5-carboxymethylaminomethyl(34) synthesis GTPase MnmE n=1 Tax=Treponema sp. TaxID=166 RepID=UPI00298DDDD2|nr:tRNA uridine-5-carboxymethylaminomethyl(34) synthesis GTPase MnmE [Treponema sp.]MCR5613883.1 tRNA uridine-5-carboxymethylaminomethyl(34) synthesis GTPase MnmE [Treponema sp.]